MVKEYFMTAEFTVKAESEEKAFYLLHDALEIIGLRKYQAIELQGTELDSTQTIV